MLTEIDLTIQIFVDRYRDSEIYAFDYFCRNGDAQFYNTWESDRTFRVKCPLGLPGKKFKFLEIEFTVRSFSIKSIGDSNFWIINASKSLEKHNMNEIMKDVHAKARIQKLEDAIRAHRNQKADDRCWLDDLTLYSVLDDEIEADNRIGDECAMLSNCERFLMNRCDKGGPWKSYAEFETELARRDKEILEKNETIRLLQEINSAWRWTCDPAEDCLKSMSDGMAIVMAARDLKKLLFEPDLSGTPPDLR